MYFKYTVEDASGTLREGFSEADNSMDLDRRLVHQGFLTVEITRVNAPVFTVTVKDNSGLVMDGDTNEDNWCLLQRKLTKLGLEVSRINRPRIMNVLAVPFLHFLAGLLLLALIYFMAMSGHPLRLG